MFSWTTSDQEALDEAFNVLVEAWRRLLERRFRMIDVRSVLPQWRMLPVLPRLVLTFVYAGPVLTFLSCFAPIRVQKLSPGEVDMVRVIARTWLMELMEAMSFQQGWTDLSWMALDTGLPFVGGDELEAELLKALEPLARALGCSPIEVLTVLRERLEPLFDALACTMRQAEEDHRSSTT